jgi:Domain of unknown function.
MIHICAVVKNELPYIRHWVDYHLNLGVDKITLYIHESDIEPYREILPHNNVDFIEWNLHWSENCRPQIRAYDHFVSRNQQDNDYTFFIDIDEYITPPNATSTLFSLVDRMVIFNRDGLALPWVYYNANGQIFYEDKPVTERFTTISPYNRTGGYIKSFFKNTGVVSVSIHLTRTKLGTVDQNGNDNLLPGHNEYGVPTFEFCQENGWWHIRHYFTKSWEEFVYRRMLNGNMNQGKFMHPNKFFDHNPDLAQHKNRLLELLDIS